MPPAPKLSYIAREIRYNLGYERLTNAVLVGAGKLGRALLDYDGFEDFGVQIIAGFDRNEQAIHMGKTAKAILPIRELHGFCKANEVKAIGIRLVCALEFFPIPFRPFGLWLAP